MKNISLDEGVKLEETSISLLAYADDIIILGNDTHTLKSLCVRLIEAAKKVGLQINEGKIK